MSDIHANKHALHMALRVLEKSGATSLYVCGDIVGYGSFPNECCEELRRNGATVVKGNHDAAMAGCEKSFESMSAVAKKAIMTSRNHIQDTHKTWLADLPYIARNENMIFAHACLPKSETWRYACDMGGANHSPDDCVDVREVMAASRKAGAEICFLGHSHVPTVFHFAGKKFKGAESPSERNQWTIPLRKGALVDVGAVGGVRASATPPAGIAGSVWGNVVTYDTVSRELRYLWFYAD